MPDRAIILTGIVAGFLATLGSLGAPVEAASLIFVATFACVNRLAARPDRMSSPLSRAGFGLCAAIGAVLCVRLATNDTLALIALLAVASMLIWLRPRLLNWTHARD